MIRPVILAIRREDPTRIWERRAPLSPTGIKHLLSSSSPSLNVKIIVESCSRRVWSDSNYANAGAKIVKSLRDPGIPQAHIILGIKEPPVHEIIQDPVGGKLPRTYMMFSHTTKAQSYNMPLLSKFISDHNPLLPRLIDYELLTDPKTHKRTVGFGYFAGLAGALESLSSLSLSHLTQHGIATPLLYTPHPHLHPSLQSIRYALRHNVGDIIREQGFPGGVSPVVVGVTGWGQVGMGLIDIFKGGELPVTWIKDLHALRDVVEGSNPDNHTIYVYHVKPQDYLIRKDSGTPYTRDDYYRDPAMYESVFADCIAPYLTLLLNGVGWSPNSPRLMTTQSLIHSLRKVEESLSSPGGGSGALRGTNFGDVSCDVGGGLEFLTHSTTLSSPTLTVTPSPSSSFSTPIHIMAVDILPTSLPKDASLAFEKSLMDPYLVDLIEGYHHRANGVIGDTGGASGGREGERALERATIAKGGVLLDKWSWLNEEVRKCERASSSNPAAAATTTTTTTATQMKTRKKKVVLFGSGMVAKPVVDTLLNSKEVPIDLCVASNVLSDAQHLVAPYTTTTTNNNNNDNSASAVHVSFDDTHKVQDLVKLSDLVISLLPAQFHPALARLCIENGKHMITASYISSEMNALDPLAKSKNILILNEVGLDPGIDHCSAMSLFSSSSSLSTSSSKNMNIKSLMSFCGGLPAINNNNNNDRIPLGGYKFSWSPRGVLTAAAMNQAVFRVGGKDVTIPSANLLKAHFPSIPIPMMSLDSDNDSDHHVEFEGLANRDSLSYISTYGLDNQPHGSGELRSIMRGTLRYPGFSHQLSLLKSIGLLEHSQHITLHSWDTFVYQSMALQGFLLSPVPSTALTPKMLGQIIDTIHAMFGRDEGQLLIDILVWFHLLPSSSSLSSLSSSPFRRNNNTSSTPHLLPPIQITPIDALTQILSHNLSYQQDERDMVVLHHELITQTQGQQHHPSSMGIMEEKHTSSLVLTGTPYPTSSSSSTTSAMAKTVGLPIAIAALHILNNHYHDLNGVIGPTAHPVIWRSILDGLEEVGGVKMVENSERIVRNGTAAGVTRTLEDVVDHRVKELGLGAC